MALANSTTQLGCGRDIDDVWARADEPPDAHETACPDCRAARASLRELNEATRDLRSRDQADPDLHLDPGLVSKITSIARAEVRRGRRIPLRHAVAETVEPDLTISEQAVAGVIRHVCDRFDDVEGRRCRVEISDREAGLDPADVAISVQLRISVAVTTSIPERIETLRRAIIDAVADQIGVTADTVDIVVEDVHDV